MIYTVKLETFEGPFDLLFHLIDKNEIDIYDIPIHDVTEQYLNYIYELERLDLDITSEFLVLAATLIEIKSKMLLPEDISIELTLQDDEVDPRDELVKKLLEYKKYKIITEDFKKREVLYNKLYFKVKEEIIFENKQENDEFSNLEIDDLINAFEKLLLEHDKKSKKTFFDISEIPRDPITIEDKIDFLLNVLITQKKVSFIDMFTTDNDRLDIITTFLALLELTRLNKIKILQEKCFGGITIELCD